MELNEWQYLETQRAFDSVAENYDGPRGNNALIQRMRETMWREMDKQFTSGMALLDLGCGTGIDALHFAQHGYCVTATDWSPEMVARARARSEQNKLQDKLVAKHIGIQELGKLSSVTPLSFDGIYSNFGPLNCPSNLANISQHCAQLLKPNGKMVFTVIGRICPWEVAHYVLKRRLKRAFVRYTKQPTSVNLNKHTVWTNYYTPREFFQNFALEFALKKYYALSLFAPPPYLDVWHTQARPVFNTLAALDDALGALPVLRNMGDHFLIVLEKR